MSLFSKLLAIDFFFIFLAAILYVLFGQITVKSLRKNPKIKNDLGIKYVNGWDIINVAQALSLPRSWSQKLESSPLSSLFANSRLILDNTSKLDRMLGFSFYWVLIFSGFSGILLIFLNDLGLIQ